MKIARIITAIIYLVALISGFLHLTLKNEIYGTLWTISFGLASISLLIISIVDLINKKHKKH